MKDRLFPEPKNDNEYKQDLAYQLGVSEGWNHGRLAGIAEAQAGMRAAHAGVLSAMGIREEGDA